MPSLTQISAPQLARLIGTPACPVLIDVSLDEDFNADPFLIPTAIRWKHTDILAVAPSLQDQRVVVICQKGLKLSAGAAAMLRTAGVRAETLEGGNYGWRDGNFMRLAADKLPPMTNGASLWVTRHRPKVDRIACPWLIRRFVDPQARFLFVPPSEVSGVAEKYGAIAFDTADAPFAHKGSACSFDAFLHHWALSDPALSRMAEIIRAADTDQLDASPQAPGFLAISLGLSRMFKEDLEQLDAGLLIYDALYRWARDAQGERHDTH